VVEYIVETEAEVQNDSPIHVHIIERMKGDNVVGRHPIRGGTFL
jgi:hypothetical protein